MIILQMETATHMEQLLKGWKATGTVDIHMQMTGHKGTQVINVPKFKKKRKKKEMENKKH